MTTTQDENELRSKLHALEVEHRDLDEVITQLAQSPPRDELLVRRLKRRKLMLKDRITMIQRMLEPDVPA